MFIHISIFLFITIILPIFINQKMKIEKEYLKTFFIGVFAISLIYLLGFRNNGGADDEMYKLYYEKAYGYNEFFSLFTGKEPIFNIFRTVGYIFNCNYKIVFLLYSIVTAYFMFKALQNYFDNLDEIAIFIAGFFLIVYSSMFTVMRQAAAMSIIFYIYSFKDNKISCKKIILWILAIFCHYGVILVLILDFIIYFFENRINVLFKVICPIICFFIGSYISLNKIISFITTKLNGLYDYMNSNENFLLSINKQPVNYILFIIFFVEIIFFSTKRENVKKRKVERREKIEILQMTFFSLAFLTMRLRWGTRFSLYYILFMPFLLVNVYNYFKSKNDRKIVKMILIIMSFLCFIYIISTNSGLKNYNWSLNFH